MERTMPLEQSASEAEDTARMQQQLAEAPLDVREAYVELVEFASELATEEVPDFATVHALALKYARKIATGGSRVVEPPRPGFESFGKDGAQPAAGTAEQADMPLCPNCGSQDTQPARVRHDDWYRLLVAQAFRCNGCLHRFYRRRFGA